MKKIYKLAVLLFCLFASVSGFSQNSFFRVATTDANFQSKNTPSITPEKFVTYKADVQELKQFLFSLPTENSLGVNKSTAPVITLPMPDGSISRFHIYESSVMAPELAAKFPELRQFLGQGIDDKYATVRLDYNPTTGFHAQILSSATGRIFVDPLVNGNTEFYMSYFARDAKSPVRFNCEVADDASLNQPNPIASRTSAACLGTVLRTYRLALACTGEYSVAVNGAAPTVPGVLAAMVTAVNRVSGVYELEVAARLTLIANTDQLIYLDGNTDPYTNNNGSAMLTQNQTTIDNIIGNTNYDIGHVFSTGGGGVAYLNSVCNNSLKAGGVTGLPNPVGDAFYIDFVAHEIGHQFGGSHTFNSGTGNCAGNNRNASTAYEVGSGTTIQAYAGICGADNLQNNSDPYFHGISFDQISNRMFANACAAQTPTGNTLPVISPLLNNGLTIPIGTPFKLSGTAADANGDALTYSWEQMDLGAQGGWNAGANSTTAPLFKTRVPKATGERTFPDMAVILAGYPANPAATLGGLKGETLPQVTRAMNFRLNVRDNRAGGGGTVSSGTLGCQNSTPFIVNVAGTAPFALTSPNGGQSYEVGSTQNITWNVVGTDAAPFNVSAVKISLSTDGGLTYPTVLSASTANDGAEMLVIPNPVSTTARIKIEALGNIFFDISDANFSIIPSPVTFNFGTATPVVVGCGSTASSTITTTVSGGFATPIILTASGLPAGVTATFVPNPVTPGNSFILNLSGLNTAPIGTYNVIVTGVAGATTRTIAVPLFIPSTVPVIVLQPTDQSVCIPNVNSATFIASATGIGITYQWQVSTNGGSTYSDISGALDSSYTVTPLVASQNGNLYRVVVKGTCTSTGLTSNPAKLTVNVQVAISAQPTSKSICSADNTSFSVTAVGTNIMYQWQVSINNGPFVNLTNTAPYSGVTTPTLTITNSMLVMSGYRYRVIVSNVTCGAINSSAVTLTVNVRPAVVLSADTTTSVTPYIRTTLTATVNPPGNYNYAWYLNGTFVPSLTGASIPVTVDDLGEYYVVVTNASTGCVTTSNRITVTGAASDQLFVYPNPNAGKFQVRYYNANGAGIDRLLVVVDSKGAKVFSQQFSNITGPYGRMDVDLKIVQTGVYHVMVMDKSGKKLATSSVLVKTGL